MGSGTHHRTPASEGLIGILPDMPEAVTTIEVPKSVRERIAARAGEQHITGHSRLTMVSIGDLPLEQGALVWVDLDPTAGRAQRGPCPALVGSSSEYLSRFAIW
jgi:hypothetical protein